MAEKSVTTRDALPSRRAVVRGFATLPAASVPVAMPALAASFAEPRADAELFAFDDKFDAALDAKMTATWRFNRLEEKWFDQRPPHPVDERPMPLELAGEFKDVTKIELDTIGRIDPDHPVFAWSRNRAAEVKAALPAYNAECDRLYRELGVQDAEDEQFERIEEIDQLVQQIMDTRAQSVGGLRFKLRIASEWPSFPDRDRVLLASIRADLEAMDGGGDVGPEYPPDRTDYASVVAKLDALGFRCSAVIDGNGNNQGTVFKWGGAKPMPAGIWEEQHRIMRGACPYRLGRYLADYGRIAERA